MRTFSGTTILSGVIAFAIGFAFFQSNANASRDRAENCEALGTSELVDNGVYLDFSATLVLVQDGGRTNFCATTRKCKFRYLVEYSNATSPLGKFCLVPQSASCSFSSPTYCVDIDVSLGGGSGSFYIDVDEGFDCGDACWYKVELRQADDTVLDTIEQLKLHCFDCI